ncbi:MAG TPA: hypothetical protein VFH27_12810 [Longimicrobiaceae bacterium]|nr:hypothetical protein [Longimicrobiaceae bacterium]
MYHHCIFCSARLGANDVVEEFPVGRMLAFDAARGRLWAVCPRCRRWNLAPIEERWEAIETAEKLFRGSRLRVHSENVGLAKLADGTRLVRVGEALPGEFAHWRYGEQLARRSRAALARNATTWAVFGPVSIGLASILGIPFWLAAPLWVGGQAYLMHHGLKPVGRLRPDQSPTGAPFVLRWPNMVQARPLAPAPGEEIALSVTISLLRRPAWNDAEAARKLRVVRLAGADAFAVLRRSMIYLNDRGRPKDLLGAVGLVESEGAAGYLASLPYQGRDGKHRSLAQLPPESRLALEIALNDEEERRAMNGELAMLEAAWREAEGIAVIADRLPDGLVEPNG